MTKCLLHYPGEGKLEVEMVLGAKSWRIGRPQVVVYV